jgi:hypothetical protein
MSITELEKELKETTRRAKQALVNGNIAVYWRDSAEASEQWEASKAAFAEAELIKKQIEQLKLAESSTEA